MICCPSVCKGRLQVISPSSTEQLREEGISLKAKSLVSHLQSIPIQKKYKLQIRLKRGKTRDKYEHIQNP
ncbi:MAG: hypothetical protein AABX94_04240, partial [Nanoarchaeota archaeon]